MPEQQWLTAREVAEMFRVDPKTVAKWARRGLIPFGVTPGGHRRFPATKIREIYKGGASR